MTLSSSSLSAPAPLSDDAGRARAPATSAFARLDDLVSRDDAVGVVRVAVEPAAFAAVARHLERRAHLLARPTVSVCAPVADAWRELARSLDAAGDVGDAPAPRAQSHPFEIAARIARAATGRMIVLAEPRASAWGAAVAAELARLAADRERRLLLVIVRQHDERRDRRLSARVATIFAPTPWGPSADDVLDVDIELGSLTPDDLRRWWSAVIEGDGFFDRTELSRLAVLDRWWEESRAAPLTAERPGVDLDPTSLRLLALLGAAKQALRPAQLQALEAGGWDALRQARLVVVDAAGAVTLAEGVRAPELSRHDTLRLAEVLRCACGHGLSCTRPCTDGWSMMRAAELLAACSATAESEACAFEALRAVGDALARSDFWDRWDALLDRDGDAVQVVERLIRSAEHALELGDGDRADGLARAAMALEPDRFDVLLLHGRSSHARGDVTTATLSLMRALGVAANAAERARAAGLLAQVRHAAGDPDQAARYAAEAIDHAADVETRLEGRNVLGKLLLGREAWRDAEAHFAEDAYEAATAGLRTAELRAQLNRGIAIMCRGHVDEARALLQEVLAQGERHGVLNAVAFALSNLAAIAIIQHRYEDALALSERAIDVRRVLGGRIGLVEPIAASVELRLRLGLVDEAEQGLRFGLRACADSVPMSRQGHFARVASMIYLEQGRTAEASREVVSALAMATSSGDHLLVAQCHRLEAEIALEDGDLARARAALERAGRMRHTSFGQAELAVLEARLARASGLPFAEQARAALVLAHSADDAESLRAAHWLLALAYQVDGDHEGFAAHLRAAREQRDRVSLALPEPLRQRFLARRSVRLLESLGEEEGAPPTLRDAAPGAPPEARTAAIQSGRRMVGDSPMMRTLRATIARVAELDATVLVTGPTGTGKELAAEAIHRASPRRGGPLVKVNCAALVETLLLSELFGHEKGAFTGATSRRRGRFELAEGGTLFLDEIGDISPRTQVALLRVLQDGTFERVGGTTQLRANVRIVCATHRDLKAMVAQGTFREDLYYRLCGVVLEVPALRERLEDLPQLADALLRQAAAASGQAPKTLSPEALRLLGRHDWPGNVRELENALRVAALFAPGAEIRPQDLLDHVDSLRAVAERSRRSELPSAPESLPPLSVAGELARGSRRGDAPPESGAFDIPPSSSGELVYAEIRGGTKLADMKRRIEQECITRALFEAGGNITRAAELLGMKRPRLSQLVKQYDLGTMVEEIKS